MKRCRRLIDKFASLARPVIFGNMLDACVFGGGTCHFYPISRHEEDPAHPCLPHPAILNAFPSFLSIFRYNHVDYTLGGFCQKDPDFIMSVRQSGTTALYSP
jgi:hypothetical protein